MIARKHVKRIWLGIVSCMMVFVTCVMGSLVVLGEEEKETLTVGVPVDRCPVFYQDPDTNEIIGIGADLMRAAAKEAGYEVTFESLNGATLKQALDNEEYDVVMPFGSAIASKAGYASIVSENLIQTPFTLVTEDNRELPQLNELKVGMLQSLGGAAETVRELYPGIVINMYATMDDSVRALRSGEVDALLHNSYVWSYVLQKPAYSGLKVQPSAMFSMDFRIGALDTEEGRILIERLNEGIKAISDTRRQAIILDYTSRKLYEYDFSDYLYEYWLILLMGTLLFVSVGVIAIQKRNAFHLEQEEKIRRLIDQDPLTGVLSLSGFRKRAEELLREHPDIPYLLSYSNIRNFKFINASQGMAAGDELLKFWADKACRFLTDEEAIGRIEGDHFVILRRFGGDEQLQNDDRAVLDPVRNFFVDRNKGNKVQISSGVYVLMPEDYQKINVDRMLDFARVAEKRIQDTYKDGTEFYNPEQWEKGKWVTDVLGFFPIAVKSGELQVWYQPQVNFDTGEITGAEALCRWNHAKLGWLSPAEFIPALEEAGLIYDLDCYVWERVCQDLQRWNTLGHHLSVSVNLSRCDIKEERNIPGHFFDLIQKHDLTPDQLRIEITETAYVENPDLLIKTTVKLREFGFQVEMDDFGSGYSSLNMLKEVPVDRIKLDLHFLTGTGDPERGRIIISYMVQMAHALGMSMIAEGVENPSQAGFLKSRGCLEMQGFYFYKPMTVKEYEILCNIQE